MKGRAVQKLINGSLRVTLKKLSSVYVTRQLLQEADTGKKKYIYSRHKETLKEKQAIEVLST